MLWARRLGVFVFVGRRVFALVRVMSSAVGGVAAATTTTFECCFFLFDAGALFFVFRVFAQEVACCDKFKAAEDDHVGGRV
jgi:hypothetical protein